jgi:hypothetical protein
MSGPWVLAWHCDPTVAGVPAPFSLTITVATPDDPLLGPQPLDTTCASGNTQGTVGVRLSGEQWLIVGTGGNGGAWTLTIEVPGNDTSAAVLPTPPPTPAPTATPLPTTPPVATLPFTLSGQASSSVNVDQFTAARPWHFIVSCVNDPAASGDSPQPLWVRVYQPSDANLVGYVPVGQEVDAQCDGTTTDSNTTNPAGFPPGISGWEVRTGGNWTITVEPE